MSRKKEDEGMRPTASAGLLRFFEEESHGFKVRPELVIISGVLLIVAVVMAHVLYPNFL
jgi:preprotein translocase subunit Sec61beta